MDLSVTSLCYLRVDRGRYLSSDDNYGYSIFCRAEKLYGKAIKPIRCYSRYFMIDCDHILHLVGVGVMAHEEEADVYWVAEDVVQTAVVSDQDFEDFKKKQGHKFVVTPLFFFEVPRCIAENWDGLSDSQKERAMTALRKGALNWMFCPPRPDQEADTIWGGFYDDCANDVERSVDAIEEEASSLVFDFDFLSKAEVIIFIPVLRHVLEMMINDIRDDAGAADNTSRSRSRSRSEEDGLREDELDLPIGSD